MKSVGGGIGNSENLIADFLPIIRTIPQVKIILISEIIENFSAIELFKPNLAGWLLKENVTAAIIDIVKIVAQGSTCFDRGVVEQLVALAKEPNVSARLAQFDLTPCEQKIVIRIVKGEDNLTIANALSLAHQTVRNHISQIYKKLGVSEELI